MRNLGDRGDSKDGSIDQSPRSNMDTASQGPTSTFVKGKSPQKGMAEQLSPRAE